MGNHSVDCYMCGVDTRAHERHEPWCMSGDDDRCKLCGEWFDYKHMEKKHAKVEYRCSKCEDTGIVDTFHDRRIDNGEKITCVNCNAYSEFINELHRRKRELMNRIAMSTLEESRRIIRDFMKDK